MIKDNKGMNKRINKDPLIIGMKKVRSIDTGLEKEEIIGSMINNKPNKKTAT
ncbi:MAG: hypothetical protein ACFFCS_21575 [Candidatus Hodarchaeota archaeon]